MSERKILQQMLNDAKYDGLEEETRCLEYSLYGIDMASTIKNVFSKDNITHLHKGMLYDFYECLIDVGEMDWGSYYGYADCHESNDEINTYDNDDNIISEYLNANGIIPFIDKNGIHKFAIKFYFEYNQTKITKIITVGSPAEKYDYER